MRLNVIKTSAFGVLSACFIMFCSVASVQAKKTVLRWNGTCYGSQVYAKGKSTITKTSIGKGLYKVTLAGSFKINSATYGYVRHMLPPGFRPIGKPGKKIVTCQKQLYGKRDMSKVGNYGGKGLNVRNDDYKGYKGKGVLFFPEKFHNKDLWKVRCTWKTRQVDKPAAWKKCSGIKVKSLAGGAKPIKGGLVGFKKTYKCPYGNLSTAFSGKKLALKKAGATCRKACDRNKKCRYADLYWTKKDSACYLKTNKCGSWKTNRHPAYYLYTKK